MKPILLVVVAVLLVGCAPAKAPGPAKGPAVAVSIAPLAAMAATLLGDPGEVATVILPGESPATFDPGPRRMAQFQDARLFFACGVPMENQLLPRLRQGHPVLEIVNVTTGLPRGTLASHDDHDHGDTDPHLWLDPHLMRKQVRVMAGDLAVMFPKRAAAILARADSLEAVLTDLDLRLKDELAPVRGRDMFVFHPAFGYLAQAYGLRQVAIEQGGLDPSPRHLARVLEGIKDQGARAVFAQPQFSLGSARAVAREAGIRLVVLDPLAPDYVANMTAMAHAIREALDESD